MARLGIALISVVNATMALAAPKTLARPCSSAPPVVEICRCGVPMRMQRPPRVPRRERFMHAEWRVGE
ncbi:MAG TPA: hypothetical protein VH855_09770 [Acetobacteraceae bacterium]